MKINSMLEIIKHHLKRVQSNMPRTVKAQLKRLRDHRDLASTHKLSIAQLQRCAQEISASSLAQVGNLPAWEARRPLLLQQLQWMLGLDPLPARTDLKARQTGRIERSGYHVENIVFQSLPGLYVTANLYLPKGVSGQVPCILYLCGHKLHPAGAKTQYQERFLWYPAHGYACLALDSLLAGEVIGLHGGTQRLNQWDWFSLGYTPAGVEVWNAMRALDYLCSRKEIAGDRIGVTGISGGGIVTWYLSALDDRVKAAAPSCSTYTIGSQVSLGLVGSQCDCTFYPNVYQLDFSTVGALIAPRPLLFTNGRKDRIFPPAGFRAVYQRIKPIYDLYGPTDERRERLKSVESDSAHTDPPMFLEESRRWMCQWLDPAGAGERRDLTDTGPVPEAPEVLRCLTTAPADAVNAAIHQRFITPAPPALPTTRGEWQARKARLLQTLRQTVFAWFPAWPTQITAKSVIESGGYAALFAKFSEWRIETEPGVAIRAYLFQPKSTAAPSSLLLVVKGICDTKAILDDELLPLLHQHAVLVIYPRFTEIPLLPEQRAEIERSAALCGRTCASMQVWDLLVALRWSKGKLTPAEPSVTAYGAGDSGVVALYAAALDEGIQHVVLKEPPDSHRLGQPLLTVMRTTDIPEVAGTLAPRRLSFLGHIPVGFHPLPGIYRFTGSESAIQSFPSLVDAMAKWPPLPH